MKKLVLATITVSLLAGCQLTKSPTGRTQALMYSSSDMSSLGAQSFEEMKKKENYQRFTEKCLEVLQIF